MSKLRKRSGPGREVLQSLWTFKAECPGRSADRNTDTAHEEQGGRRNSCDSARHSWYSQFYLGYTGPGVLLLIASFLSVLLFVVVIGIFGIIAISIVVFIEGILYLTKTDEDFHQTYVENRKDWF